MVNNQQNNHLSPLNSMDKVKIMTYDVGNPDPGIGQAQKYGSAKLINEIKTLPS